MKNKVLFFLPSLNCGGAERVTINIIKQLDAKHYDIDILLVHKQGSLLNLIPNYVNIHHFKSSGKVYSILELRRHINYIKPNVIYSTLYRTHIGTYLALIMNKHKPIKVFRMPNSPKLVIENKQISSLMYHLLNISLKSANTIIAQTPEMKLEISKYHKVDFNKIQVLINPIDKDLINQSVKQLDTPFNSEFINIVASGRIVPQKGFDILIQAFKKIYQQNTQYRLYIIGEDYIGLQKEYEELILKLGLQNTIYFLGFQHNPYQYYKYANLFVLSSRWEGLPNTVLENLYLNKPIIATDCIPFMSTLIENGKNGYLVEPENIEMLADAILKYNTLTDLGFLSGLSMMTIEEVFNNNQQKLEKFPTQVV